jgi:hypothetical protein
VMSSLASAWPCSSAKIRCQVPSRCQRRNKSYARAQGPYRSGTSRHGTPVRMRNRMPSISCRLVHIGGRPGFLPRGNNGSRQAHCVSVRSPCATEQDHPTSRSTSDTRPRGNAVALALERRLLCSGPGGGSGVCECV